MKKKQGKLWMLSFIFLVCGIILLASCSKDTSNEQLQDSTTYPITLPTPQVTLNGNVAEWEKCQHATKFEISIDGNLTYLENSITTKTLENGQTFKIRALGDGSKYIDSPWSNSVTYTKPSDPSDPETKYTIIWKSGDIVLETDTDVIEGTVPAYDGTVPTKASDAQYSYTFAGWTPEVVAANGDTTYVAVFESVKNKYTVTWKNGSVILETDTNVEYGTMPTYDGQEPTKVSDSQYTYTFDGWSPSIDVITGDITYEAIFEKHINKYTVTFLDEDGVTVLDTITVDYGHSAIYSKGVPTKKDTEGYTYEFDCWVIGQGGNIKAILENITIDQRVYASYTAHAKKFNVYLLANENDYGKVSTAVLNDIDYGTEIIINDDTIIIGNHTIVAQPFSATAQYTFSFSSWTTPTTIGVNTIITANFVRETNTYDVIWMNDDSILEIDLNVPYGLTPQYNGKTPLYNGDGNYIFSGWTPTVSSVTGDITYYADFIDATGKCVVTFYDENGTTVLAVVAVNPGESAIYPNIAPTKNDTASETFVFDKWVTTKDGHQEAILTNISKNLLVYAKYLSSIRRYTVTFCDYDGTIIKAESVAYGSAATAPTELYRDGYKFKGWDKEYNKITQDTQIVAQYVQQFTVQFLDYDNSIIETQLVDYNGSAETPQDPYRRNYRFTGWSDDYTNIVSDLVIKAQYVRQYKIQFVDYNGTLLKEEYVDEKKDATPPETKVPDELEGYEIDGDGWDKDYTNVSSDLIVTAKYKLKKHTVKFVLPDGATIGEIQSVEYGFSAIAPEYPEFYLEGTGDYTKVYGFTRWNKSFNSVTKDLVIEAVYESDYTKPVIIIEYSQERNGDAKLYILNHKSIKLNAIEFTINYYSASGGNISINSATINSASPLWVEDSKGNNNNQYVINNNESTFTFAWSDANGKQFDWCSKVITFNFSTDGAVVGEETFRIDRCSAIVSDGNNEKLVQLTPVVVYRYR